MFLQEIYTRHKNRTRRKIGLLNNTDENRVRNFDIRTGECDFIDPYVILYYNRCNLWLVRIFVVITFNVRDFWRPTFIS